MIDFDDRWMFLGCDIVTYMDNRWDLAPLLANSAVHSFDSVLVGSQGNFPGLELRSPFTFEFSAAKSAKFWLFFAFSGRLSVKTRFSACFH